MDKQLDRIVIDGFKSIVKCDLPMANLNVLIGANGVGKSNFIGFFKLIQEILSKNLQVYISKKGGPDVLLHFGRKKTASINAELHFGKNAYKFKLEPTDDNRMMFVEENLCWFTDEDKEVTKEIGSGHFESQSDKIKNDGHIYKYVIPVMENWRVYHFHDTSDTALVKTPQLINDNFRLRPDASNLAACLYMMQEKYPEYILKIEKIIKLVAPFFGRFLLRPSVANSNYIELEWFEQGSDIPFKAHLLSDGTLRFICLATLLLQPKAWQPKTIIIDEPELGLHPYAIVILAGLLKSVAKEGKQVIISTQSVDLLSEFLPEDVIVVNRKGEHSTFTRLDTENLTNWLDEYSLGDLWKKNILGGRP